jgi:hypothetical protein
MATAYVKISAMPVVTGSGELAPVSAIPVVVVSDGSVRVAPDKAQPVIDVTADATFPRVKTAAIPIVYAGGSPSVAKVEPIPVFVVGTVP